MCRNGRLAYVNRLVLAALLVGGGACESNTQISAPGGRFGGLRGKDEADEGPRRDPGLGVDGGTGAAVGTGTGGGLNTAVGTSTAETPTVVDWPRMDFRGHGVATCQGDQYPTTARVQTSVDGSRLDINLMSAEISSDKGSIQEQANQQIAQNTGVTTYARLSEAQRDAFLQQGVKLGSFAIFALGVTKQTQGQSFVFDRPLPVYPLPSGLAVFQALMGEGPKSWSAHVSGSWNFDVTVTLQVMSAAGSAVTVKITSDIAQDQPGQPEHRALYEVFPLPREAIYDLNVDEHDVRQINQTSWFKGDQCDGQPEQVSLTYALCQKVTAARTDNFPCP